MMGSRQRDGWWWERALREQLLERTVVSGARTQFAARALLFGKWEMEEAGGLCQKDLPIGIGTRRIDCLPVNCEAKLGMSIQAETGAQQKSQKVPVAWS